MYTFNQCIQRLVILLLSLAATFFSNAQNRSIISGTLVDSNGVKPVPWATVGLYRSSDKEKPLQNIFSNSRGKFEFTEVDTGTYMVIATYTGYKDGEWDLRVDTGQTLIDLGPMILYPEPQQLGGVVVKASVRRPLLEQEDEKMIFNAESDPSLEGLTAVDVLRKTPFLSVDAQDNVQLNGQSNFKILLNGKETSMFSKNLKEALKSLPAGLIKKVEVSTNPSSKYDGEGVGGVINIITNKKIAGYNGNAGISYSTRNSYNVNGSINAKLGKAGLSAYYGVSGGRPPAYEFSSEIESLNPVAFYKRISEGSSLSKYTYEFGNLEFAWDIDSLNSLSIYGGIGGGDSRSHGNTRYDMILPDNAGAVTSFFSNQNRFSYPGYNTGVDYIRKFKNSAGREMAIKTYYNSYSDDSYNYSEQNNAGFDRFVVNDNRAPSRELTVQADMTYPLKKERKLEFGIKSVMRKATSDYRSLVKYDKDQEYSEDPTNANYFNYRQGVYSAFATYSFKWKKIGFKLGGRFEQTHVDGDFAKTETRVLQDYGTFMPSVYLSYKLRNIHSLSLAYSKRLRRPYIWNLNPFRSNIDSFNISYGNPELGPDVIHSVTAGYSVFKGNTNINLRLSQSFSNRQIIQYSVFDEETGINATVVDNVGLAYVTGLSLSLSARLTKKMGFSASNALRYTTLRNRFRPGQENQGWGGYAFINTDYSLTKKWSVYLSGSYWRSDPQLQGQSTRTINYSFGTNYKLFDQKLTLSATASNFFRKYITWRGHFVDDNFIRNTFSRNQERNINFSLRWSFGQLKDNVSRKRGVSNDDIRK